MFSRIPEQVNVGLQGFEEFLDVFMDIQQMLTKPVLQDVLNLLSNFCWNTIFVSVNFGKCNEIIKIILILYRQYLEISYIFAAEIKKWENLWVQYGRCDMRKNVER